MDDDVRKGRIDDEGATLVLERASELDVGRGRWVDLADLRDAALEAGISATAFERALAEVEALRSKLGRTSRRSTPRPRSEEEPGGSSGLWAWARPGLMLAAGLFLGFLAIFLERGIRLDEPAGVIFSFVLAFQLALYLVVRHRRDRSILRFEIDLAALWAGLTFMLLVLSEPRMAEDIAGFMAVVWSAAAAVGAALVKLPFGGSRSPGPLLHRHRTTPPDAGGSPPRPRS